MSSDDSTFTRALNAAAGYCALRMWQDAWDQLETLPAEDRARPEVLRLRLGIFVGLERWDSAAVLAAGMLDQGSGDESTFLLGAIALRRLSKLDAARAHLLRGEEYLKATGKFWLVLAGLECQLGELAACKASLARAFKLNPELRSVALEEEDLGPFWDSF